MKTRIEIMVSQDFAALHNYDHAPEEVKFLRTPHRHMFDVRVWIPITGDRQVEFFMAKDSLQTALSFILAEGYKKNVRLVDMGNRSCEALAQLVIAQMENNACGNPAKRFFVSKCEVWEDGENATIVTADRTEE